jgi:hypothetical protein
MHATWRRMQREEATVSGCEVCAFPSVIRTRLRRFAGGAVRPTCLSEVWCIRFGGCAAYRGCRSSVGAVWRRVPNDLTVR